MMKSLNFPYWSKVGLRTMSTSMRFFYGHTTLIIISLVPSLSRAMQMLYFHHSILLELIVTVTRIALFLFIISYMTKTPLAKLTNGDFWAKLLQTSSKRFEHYWPYGTIVQLIVFVVFLFGVANGLIYIFSHLFIYTIQQMYGGNIPLDALHNASVYFLKNMSVIPLSLVYIAMMFGVKDVHR